MARVVVALVLVLGLGPIGAAAQRPPPPPRVIASVQQVEPFDYVCRSCTGSYTRFAREEAEFLSQFQSLGIKATNVEMAVYWNSPLTVRPEELRWDIGFPVAAGTGSAGELTLKRFNWPRVAVAVHVGPYATTYRTINALYSWIHWNGMKTAGGPCVEHYLDPEPAKVADANKRTAIWIPVEWGR